jgi:uncharacterized membrane protein YczE
VRRRLLQLAVSWSTISLGIPFIVRAKLGVAPADVLNTGLSKQLGWSLGLAFVVTGLLTFAIGVMLGGRLGWASVAGSVVIGPAINLVLRVVPTPHHLVTRALALLGGVLLVAVGVSFAIKAALGPGPSEVLMLGLVRRGLSIVPARWISDAIPVVVGVVLGGSIGVGTLVFVLVMGPLVKFGLRALHFEPPPA